MFALRIKIIIMVVLFAKHAQKLYCFTQRHRYDSESLAFEAIETIIYGNCQSYQSFISSRNFLKRLRRSGRSHGKQALDVLSFIRRKRQINRQLCPFLLACVQPPSPPLRKKSTFPERRGWLYTTKTEEGCSQFDLPLPTSDFRRPFSALVVHRSISKTHRRKLILP